MMSATGSMARYSSPGNGMQRTFEGSSLETIRHMVASGIGLTVLPRASVPDMDAKDGMLQFRPFDEPVPSRRVVIVWRKSFTRKAAIDAVCEVMGAAYPKIVADRDLVTKIIAREEESFRSTLQRGTEFLDEILAAPMVHEPLTKLQCCPTSDGAGARGPKRCGPPGERVRGDWGGG